MTYQMSRTNEDQESTPSKTHKTNGVCTNHNLPKRMRRMQFYEISRYKRITRSPARKQDLVRINKQRELVVSWVLLSQRTSERKSKKAQIKTSTKTAEKEKEEEKEKVNKHLQKICDRIEKYKQQHQSDRHYFN